jgi:hypothetical protein
MITDAFHGDAFQRFAEFVDRNFMNAELKKAQKELREGLDDYDTDFENVALKALNIWGEVTLAPEWIRFHYITGDVVVHRNYALYVNGVDSYKLSAEEFYCWRARYLDW